MRDPYAWLRIVGPGLVGTLMSVFIGRFRVWRERRYVAEIQQRLRNAEVGAHPSRV